MDLQEFGYGVKTKLQRAYDLPLKFLTQIRNISSRMLKRVATGWTFLGSSPVGGDIFRTRPHRPLGPTSLLYSGYRVPFPGVKRPGRGVDHPPHLAPRLKKE
jgi:hypothetical protein